MSEPCRLTTYDNPYNPFDDFEHWFNYDVAKGYNSCGLLARFYVGNDAMTEKEIEEANEEAIDKVMSIDFECIYKKVYAKDYIIN